MRDWIGLWFRIQAERGHSDEAPFFLLRLPEGTPENFSFRHRYQDGIAAMHWALGLLGLDSPRIEARKIARPPLASYPRLLWRGLLGNRRRSRPQWRLFRPERKEKSRGFCFLVLSPKANEALSRIVEKHRFSVGSYLLAQLSGLLEESLLRGSASGQWLLPVNMRPAFPGKVASGNCVSFLSVSADRNPARIQAQVREAFAAYEHWSNWWAYHIGRVIGYRGMRKAALRASSRTFRLGSFTDLGEWMPAASPAAEDFRQSIWAIAPPGTPNNPVGCATVSWFGRRSISLRLHPAVAENETGMARAILGRWLEALSGELELPESEFKIFELELAPSPFCRFSGDLT